MVQSATSQFEPMTIGMILDRTIRLYLQNLSLMIGIIAFTYILPFTIVVVLTLITVAQPGNPILPGVMAALTALAWALVAQPLSAGATTYAIGERFLDRQATVGGVLRVAWSRFGSLLGAQIVAGLMVMLGFLLFVVPGVIFMVSYAFVASVIMLENANSAEGRKRSWELARGNRWKIFAIWLVVGLLTAFVNGAIDLLVLALVGQSSTVAMVANLAGELVSYIVVPIPTIATVLLYYDLRMRKEGFDLEMLNRALSQP